MEAVKRDVADVVVSRRQRHVVQVLKDFGVPAEVTVVSAHRTPDRMLDYARGAAGRGIRVRGSASEMLLSKSCGHDPCPRRL